MEQLDKLQKLEEFYQLLIEWNQKINLTRIIEKEDVYLKHFYDSLTLIKAVDLTKDLTLLDVGTGAGFPGIVLKIVFPNLKIVDANGEVKFFHSYLPDIQPYYYRFQNKLSRSISTMLNTDTYN